MLIPPTIRIPIRTNSTERITWPAIPITKPIAIPAAQGPIEGEVAKGNRGGIIRTLYLSTLDGASSHKLGTDRPGFPAGGRRWPAPGGLPAGGVRDARVVPGDQARQAHSGRRAGGGRQDSARQVPGRLPGPSAGPP